MTIHDFRKDPEGLASERQRLVRRISMQNAICKANPRDAVAVRALNRFRRELAHLTHNKADFDALVGQTG